MPNYVVSIIIEAKDQNTKQIAAEVEQAIRGVGEQGEETGQKLRDAFSGAVLTYAFGRAIPLAREAIATYVQGQSALSGLRSMARATGEDYDTALDQLKAFTTDGLVPMEDATVALRNLLQHGFGLNEAMQILERFKDAAAYGRKEQIELGDAVRLASEAVKIGSQRGLDSISIVGDMTAAHRGLAGELGIEAEKLTEAQRLQAEYTSIITQTNTAVGDSAKLHGELAGKIAEATEKSRQAKQAIGGALAPACSTLLDSLTPALDGVAKFADECPRATAVLMGGAGLVAAVSGLAVAFALMGPTGAIVVGVVAGILAIAGAITALIEKFRRSDQALIDNATATQEHADRLRGLIAQYEDLKKKQAEGLDVEKDLHTATTDLIASVPSLTGLLPEQATEFHNLAQEARDYADALDRIGEAEKQMVFAQLAAENAKLSELKAQRATAEAEIAAASRQPIGESRVKSGAIYAAQMEDTLKGLNADIADQEGRVQRLLAAWKALAGMDDPLRGVRVGADDTAEAINDVSSALDLLGSDKDVLAPISRGARTATTGMSELDIAVRKLWEDFRSGADEAKAVEAFAAAQRAAEAFARSLSGRLAQIGKGWSEWQGGAADAIGEVGSNLAQFLGAVVSGNKEATDRLKEFWEGFFSWLVQKAMEIFVYWLLGRVLSSFGFVGASNAVGAFAGSAINDKLPKMVTREIGAGLSVSGRGSSGLAVEQIADLTRELRLLVPVLAVESRGGGARIIEEHNHWHIATMDAASLRREIRNGELGREIRLAQRAGRVGR